MLISVPELLDIPRRVLRRSEKSLGHLKQWKILKKHLKQWSWDSFSNIFSEVKKAEDKIIAWEIALEDDPSSVNLQELKAARI